MGISNMNFRYYNPIVSGNDIRQPQEKINREDDTIANKTGNTGSEKSNNEEITNELNRILQDVKTKYSQVQSEQMEVFFQMQTLSSKTPIKGNNESDEDFNARQQVFDDEMKNLQNKIIELSQKVNDLEYEMENINKHIKKSSTLTVADVESLRREADAVINSKKSEAAIGNREPKSADDVDKANKTQVGNSDEENMINKNITQDDLWDIYTTCYLKYGCGGANGILYSTIKSDDPNQDSRNAIENFLKENNITNVTVDELISLFKKVDENCKGIHNIVKEHHNNQYTNDDIKALYEAVDTHFKYDANIFAITDEQWQDMENIYRQFGNSQEKLMNELSKYFRENNLDLTVGNITDMLEEKVGSVENEVSIKNSKVAGQISDILSGFLKTISDEYINSSARTVLEDYNSILGNIAKDDIDLSIYINNYIKQNNITDSTLKDFLYLIDRLKNKVSESIEFIINNNMGTNSSILDIIESCAKSLMEEYNY